MLDKLTAVYEEWLEANPNVPKVSADEALLAVFKQMDDLDTSQENWSFTFSQLSQQCCWLRAFSDLWLRSGG